MARAYLHLGKNYESADLYKRFFESYHPSESFHVDITQEKENFLNVMVNFVVEAADVPELYDGPEFTFSSEIARVSRELIQENPNRDLFRYMALLGGLVNMFNPQSSIYFKEVFTHIEPQDILEEGHIQALSGEFGDAVRLFEESRYVDYEDAYGEAERTEIMKVNIHISNMLKYMHLLIVENKKDIQLQQELLQGANAIFGSAKNVDTQGLDKTALRMTETFLKSLLYFHARTDHEEFAKNLLLNSENSLTEEEAMEMIRNVQQNGEFN